MSNDTYAGALAAFNVAFTKALAGFEQNVKTWLRERTIDMPTFIYLYRGPAPTPADAEQAAERAAAFGAWMEKVGAALADVGRPFGASVSVRDDGTEGPAGDLIGYSLVEARDLAEAKALTDGLPFLANGDGTCAVEIFELMSM